MKKAAIPFLIALLLYACGGEPRRAAAPEKAVPTLMGQEGEKPDLTIPPVDFKFDPVVRPLGKTAHAKYLTDKVLFRPAPLPSVKAARTAVVGSTVARFFPGAAVKTAADANRLPVGQPIPIGTLLAVGDAIRDKGQGSDSDMDGMFEFQDHYNWFYETEYNGKRGLVFGADLVGLGQSAAQNSLTSFYYTRPEKSPAFYTLNGRKELSRPFQSTLARDRIAFEKVGKAEYRLSMDLPDDMVALYAAECRERERSVFFSTDLFSHTLHLLFDRLLQASEEKNFYPVLATLVDGYLAEIARLKAQDKGDQPGYTKVLKLAETYFQVPQALLLSVPPVKEDDEATEDDKEQAAEPAAEGPIAPSLEYPENVQAELTLIKNASGYARSPNFFDQIDYSQFKPRGHYTKNALLTEYFRAMMWFGRINLSLNPVDERTMKPEEYDSHLTRAALAVLLNRIAEDHPDLFNLWRSCFDTVTFLIGQSDDLSFYDLKGPVGQYPFGDFASWADDRKKIEAFLSWIGRKARPPRINDQHNRTVQIAGFRLFGQRFTYDSFIHDRASHPRLPKRYWVQGLDVMKVFGSQAAEKLLALTDYRDPEYRLKPVLDLLQKQYAGFGPDLWGATYYNRALYLVKSQAQFEQGQGFFFTETPAWSTKALLSSHGAWAELRHDTILYVKQAGVGEMGGFWEPTFRTVPVPRPVHYIEPNRYFFQNAYLLIVDLLTSLRGNPMIADGYLEKLSEYATLLKNLLAVIEREIADRPISREQNEYLVGVPIQLARLILPAEAGYANYTENEDELRMALVADVFTNGREGKVLETAVGIPYRLHAALNDGQGGKRIAVGYTFSYFEFRHPMSDRLNDEQWKAIVYADKPDMDRYLPFWARGILVK